MTLDSLPRPQAVILTIGDELLLGETIDTNAAWLGSELTELGMGVVRRIGVGDNEPEIINAMRSSLESAELVIATGGLGPTEDDRTRNAFSRGFARVLSEDPELAHQLRERWRRRRGQGFPESNLRQALVPEGAVVLPNTLGTAPGLYAEVNDGLVVLLPGVPREVRSLFETELKPRLLERFSARLTPLRRRVIFTSGISESDLADRIEAVQGQLRGISLAYLPGLYSVRLRLSAHLDLAIDEAESALDSAEELLTQLVGEARIESETGDVVRDIGDLLIRSGQTLAVAESCTGGLIMKRLTDFPGAGLWFNGGMGAYANEVKVAQLGVDAELLESEGAVSQEVAESMARGVTELLNADYGIGITGIAGPSGGSEDKPVGTVWYAVSSPHGVRSQVTHFSGNREMIRERSSQAALMLLYTELRRAPEGEVGVLRTEEPVEGA